MCAPATIVAFVPTRRKAALHCEADIATDQRLRDDWIPRRMRSIPARKSIRSSCSRICRATLRANGNSLGSSCDHAVDTASRKWDRSRPRLRASCILPADAKDVSHQGAHRRPLLLVRHAKSPNLLANAFEPRTLVTLKPRFSRTRRLSFPAARPKPRRRTGSSRVLRR
jgi:hypothetical protein